MITARSWREVPQRYRLEAVKSKRTGKVYYPPRMVEDAFKPGEFETIKLSREGKILSYTVIRTPATQFKDAAPYALVILETPEGARLLTQLVDCDINNIKIGDKVTLEFRLLQKEGDHGMLSYGHKAVPARK